MSTITRLYISNVTSNVGAAGLVSKTSSDAAPIASKYVLVDSTVMTDVEIGASNDYASNVTLCIHVGSFDVGATGRVVVWEVQAAASSGAPSSVTGAVPVFVAHFQGGLSASSDEVIRIPWYDIPDAMFGQGTSGGSNSAWYAVQFLTENGTTITSGFKFEAWLEY